MPTSAPPGSYDDLDRALREREDVVELKLTSPLSELPPEVRTLENLEVLRLMGTGISSLPEWLPGLTRLKRLELSGNRALTQIDGAVLSRLTGLEALVFNEGALATLPDAVFSLSSLEELVLLDCLTQPTALPDAVNALSQLRVLRLGAQFTALPSDLSALTSLEVFQWRNARLTQFPEQVFRLRTLRELAINGFMWTPSPKTGPIPEAIGDLNRLEALSLPNTGVTAVPEAIGRCLALRKLELNANPIGRLPQSIGALRALDVLAANECGLTSLPESLGQCAALRCLWLNGNALSTLPDSFASLSSLTDLGLAENKLQSLPPGLKALRGLKSLGLTGNVFDAAAMAELEAFSKAQRGYVSVDLPRKAQAKRVARVPKAATSRLSPKVIAEIERLGGRIGDRAPPSRPLELELGGQRRVLPESFRQLLQDVDVKGVRADGLEVLGRWLGPVTLFVPSNFADEYEVMNNAPYIDFGFISSQGLLLLNLDDNRDLTDPDVYFLDEDEYWATEATPSGLTLSAFLSRGRPAS